LSNAFKFTERGSVKLKIGYCRNAERSGIEALERGDKVLSFAVTDTGIGIPLEKQGLIFEAFQQGDGTTSRKYGGTGLGLTISREIARLLGGQIEVQSLPGQGSTFTLYLPQNYSGADANTINRHEEPEAFIPPLPEDANMRGKTVLVIDDDARNIYAITQVLENHGINVVKAENGKVGLQVLNQHDDIDLIVMDTMMPEMDGVEAIKNIRQNSRFKELPILSLTAKAMKGDREKCIEAGASQYITKPVDPDKLIASIYHWIREPHGQDV